MWRGLKTQLPNFNLSHKLKYQSTQESKRTKKHIHWTMTMIPATSTTNISINPALQDREALGDEKLHAHEATRDSKLSGIPYPGLHDVLSGRGGHATAHSGNLKFRTLVDSYKPQFQLAKKQERIDMAHHILSIWRNQTPMGRFLTKTEPLKSDSLWEDIGDRAALKKICQALRERRSHPMIGPGQTTGAQPLSYLHRLQRNYVFPAYITPVQQEDQIEKIKQIEQDIERLKRQNLEQQRLQEQLLVYKRNRALPPSSHIPMQSAVPSASVIPPVVATSVPATEPMDIEPIPVQPARNTPPSTYGQMARQPSYGQTARGFKANTNIELPPLPPRPLKAERTNSLVRAFDDESDHSDVKMGKGSTSQSKLSNGSDDSVRRSSLMSESVGSFSTSSVQTPSMDNANRRHMRLNSTGS